MMNNLFLQTLLLMTFIKSSASCQNYRSDISTPIDTIISFKKNYDMEKKIVVYFDSLKSDYQVKNGLIVSIDKIEIDKYTRIIRLKDARRLLDIGVTHPEKSYTFLFTEPSIIYRALYKEIRDDLPLSLVDLQFPLFIDGKIISIEDSKHIDSLNISSIKKVIFLPKNSPEIINIDEVVYGVIKVIL